MANETTNETTNENKTGSLTGMVGNREFTATTVFKPGTGEGSKASTVTSLTFADCIFKKRDGSTYPLELSLSSLVSSLDEIGKVSAEVNAEAIDLELSPAQIEKTIQKRTDKLFKAMLGYDSAKTEEKQSASYVFLKETKLEDWVRALEPVKAQHEELSPESGAGIPSKNAIKKGILARFISREEFLSFLESIEWPVSE